ncbi:putative FT-interacting protein 7 [Cocos nucifera]|uniref:Putative FT-interacting protein 7 n=1 Tax=Cocos nucifera TaxID=13894 RepID=A0A8K0N5J7_COCNU|nr:putative FT-interacting protein 7 [Cocos nucifera]
MQRPLPQEDYSVKGISPQLGGGGTHDHLVEQMEYFFVQIMKAKNLPPKDITGSNVERRLGNEEVFARWYNLQKHVAIEEGDQKKREVKYASRISLRISLDGGYHILDEPPHYSGDLRPSADQLWKPSIAVLELGILGALGLQPMKTRKAQGTTDAYRVAKHGHKWARTKTLIDCFSPRWNEQYSWEVFDPDTVITVGPFDKSGPQQRYQNWEIRNWKNPSMTIVIHLVFVILVLYPELILPAVFLYLFLVSVWDRRFWPRHPPHLDTRLSHAEFAHPDELDEEFDTFPTSQSANDLVRMRYDRLRRLQTLFGDLATQGERLQSLPSGRDPTATNLFTVVCLLLAIVLYFRPRIVALLTGFYVMRHPRFRHGRPPVPLNFFRRLPSRADALF